MRKYFKMNKNEDKITNSWDATKAVTPRKFIAISANTKKKKDLKNIFFHVKTWKTKCKINLNKKMKGNNNN